MMTEQMDEQDFTILDNPLFDRQVELEGEMRHAGIVRFREQLMKNQTSGQGSQTKTGQRLVESSHERMVEAINEFMKEAESGRAGRKHTAVNYFKKLPVDVIANITARSCLDSIATGGSMTGLGVAIGGRLENEVNARLFEEKMPYAHKKFHEKAKTESQERRQWSHLLFPARLLGVELEEWDDKTRVLVGVKLVELFIASTGLIEVKLIASRSNEVYTISMTDKTLAWMEEENARLETLFPVMMPMLIQPKPWTTPTSGGYYTLQSRRTTLVKSFNRAYIEELADREMPTVYAAINALQDTPWRINTDILEVMRTIYDNGTEMCGIPSAERMAMPAKPSWMPEEGRMAREDMTEDQLEEFKQWKVAAQAVHVHNAKSTSKRAQFIRTITVADKFKGEEAIYFPHQLDWRGRAYPMPLYLQPQGADGQRGLLTFADGLPISDRIDADWLAIHGAGCFGFDKVSLEDRVQWVEENAEMILACAREPYANRWWVEADKPWQFLAFCMEWAGLCEQGYGFVSYLPVQMDGTCNGLQNFSAMLLDEVGGAAVNLVPADKPQDIYQKVADLVNIKLEDDMINHSDELTQALARAWFGNVNRKVCKRPVMTLAYGAKRFGFVGQVDEDTIKPWRMEKPESFPFVWNDEEGKPYDYGYKAAMYMGGLIWEAVGHVVIAARAAMDWLQATATMVSQEDMPINWTAPTGLLVQQAYRVPNVKRVETTFNSTRIRLSYNETSKQGKIDKRRQAAGISPNWVHSLDASHLMLTIARAAREGITSFSMIHDSYGTHAANAGSLAKFLREEFVQMYAHVDVLRVFRDDMQFQLDAQLPELPSKGKLDLNGVLESSFFFS